MIIRPISVIIDQYTVSILRTIFLTLIFHKVGYSAETSLRCAIFDDGFITNFTERMPVNKI